jgi:YkoY family integral membrane protein
VTQQILAILYAIVFVSTPIVVLEGLLSFDNALVLAAMVKKLPEDLQKKALRYGIWGAYILRGGSILAVGWLLSNPWLKMIGGFWLLYLAAKNLSKDEDDDDAKEANTTSFWWTVFQVEMADMTFSLDNIFATAAFSQNIWAVLFGVAVGILAMRFVAGIFVELIKKFPVLEKIGYVLVGYIGLTLSVEYFGHVDLSEVIKFAGVVAIMGFGLAYERYPLLNAAFSPVFGLATRVMGQIAKPIDQVVGWIGNLLANFLAQPLGVNKK